MNVIKKLFLTLICTFSSLIQALKAPDKKDHIITIWVHGTKLTPTLPGTKRFFFTMQGMHQAAAYETKYHKHTIAKTLCEIDPSYRFDHFYFYGWSGKLCFDERVNVAQDMYQKLRKLIKTYQDDHNVIPKIRIITHSHGGNVALNLCAVQDEEHPIEIHELILLACPVQENTKEYIFSDCFAKVYAFYSNNDILQALDPQGLYKNGNSKKTFSGRAFDYHDTVRQARIKINGSSPMHVDFVREKFLKHLTRCCQEIDHFHRSIISEQKHRGKQLDIRIKHGQITFRKKIL